MVGYGPFFLIRALTLKVEVQAVGLPQYSNYIILSMVHYYG